MYVLMLHVIWMVMLVCVRGVGVVFRYGTFTPAPIFTCVGIVHTSDRPGFNSTSLPYKVVIMSSTSLESVTGSLQYRIVWDGGSLLK